MIAKKYFSKDKEKLYFDYFHYKALKQGINFDTFPICLFSIVSLFAEDCHNNIRELCSLQNNLYLKGRYKSKECSLMLRLNYCDKNIGFVIARISFINQRKGNFTKLITILDKIRKQYRLGEIMIECANTDEIKAWLKKNKWVKYNYDGNYISKEAMKRIEKNPKRYV